MSSEHIPPWSFVTLAIRKAKGGDWVKLMARKATADFYGWSAVFPGIGEAKLRDGDGIAFNPVLKKNVRGHRGIRIHICRSTVNKHGQPAGLTNSFRLTNNATNFDLYAVAQAVSVDYGWMANKTGHRRSKADWDAFDLPDDYCHLDLRAAN